MKRILLHFLVCLFALLLIAACGNGDDLLKADRPRATSTPALSAVTPTSGSEERVLTPVSTPVPSGEIADVDLSMLTTEEQLQLITVPTRDLRDLALRLRPGVDEIPSVVNSETPNFQIGDQLSFWVHNSGTNSSTQITAELIYMTDVAYAWVEVDEEYDGESITASIDHFSSVIYPATREFFGSENSPGVDNDPRLHILHTTKTGRGVAGYFSSADGYSNLANPFSNEKEMFYISLSWLNSSRNYETYETVLAHEFQHMIHWANDRNEETWLNEGMSEFAQEVAGYDPDTSFVRVFSNQPDTQINTWNEVSNGNLEHYGSAYLFVSYFAQRFDAEQTKALVANDGNGIDGVTATLLDAGVDGGFDALFADWVVANYVDDPNALGYDGVYGYRLFEMPPPTIEETFSRIPDEPIQTTVNNYAADYYLLRDLDDVTLSFEGETQTRLAAAEPFSGSFAWWSNRTDDSNSRLTRHFDLRDVSPNEPLQLDITMWWDIEDDYDYGYVLASRDGQKWDILPGQNTTIENPSGNSFGDAYTGKSVPRDDANYESSEPRWLVETFDLSDYAGEEIYIRLEYVTDDAVNRSGWLIDDIAIPAIDYETDFESGPDMWESEGWLLTNNQLSQNWLIQVLKLEDNLLTDIRRVQPDTDGRATLAIEDISGENTAVLIISALAPVTTEPAPYSLEIFEK